MTLTPAPHSPIPPRHVAIIMDGNNRWARAQGKSSREGHHQGAMNVQTIADAAVKAGIEHLTLYAFSSENWNRSPSEVAELMQLMRYFLKKELATLERKKIRLHVIGEIERLPLDLQENIAQAMANTASFTRLQVTLAISYGGRQEITRAVRQCAHDVQQGRLALDSITEEVVAHHLMTADMPDPDIVIRTSGEMRLSNFLLWQSAYSEFFFVPEYWPDFSPEQFHAIIQQYHTRERRFGS